MNAQTKEITPAIRHKIDQYIENMDPFWYEPIIDDFKSILDLYGFSDVEIFFSGFHSQGDGLSFTGSWNKKHMSMNILEERHPKAPVWGDSLSELFLDVEDSRFNIYRGHDRYYHSNTMRIEDSQNEEISDEKLELSLEICRNLAGWMYARLREHYNDITSDEYVLEVLEEQFMDAVKALQAMNMFNI